MQLIDLVNIQRALELRVDERHQFAIWPEQRRGINAGDRKRQSLLHGSALGSGDGREQSSDVNGGSDETQPPGRHAHNRRVVGKGVLIEQD